MLDEWTYIQRDVIANEVRQFHEISASQRPEHHAAQGFAPRNDYFMKPFTMNQQDHSEEVEVYGESD